MLSGSHSLVIAQNNKLISLTLKLKQTVKYFPKITGILTLLSGCLLSLGAQTIAPGGVLGFERWYAGKQDKAETTYWVNPLAPDDRLRLSAQPAPGISPLLNFNPAPTFSGSAAGFELALPKADLSQVHIFTVYRSADTLYEKSIWSLEQEGSTQRLLTTRRMADLAGFQYLNFTQPAKDGAELRAYFLHGAKARDKAAGPPLIRIGTPPVDYDLPVRSFRGVIPEIVVYQRFLNPQERRRVESYLALKYGITLRAQEPASYLNAAGQTIWDGLVNADYHHCVTGIGRDDASGLRQEKSTSSEAAGLLTIGYDSAATVPDNHFLIWGDDQAPLVWRRDEPGQPTRLARNWLMTRFGITPPGPTQLLFDTKALFSKLPEGHQYWLAVDRSGTGAYAVSDVDYYPLGERTADGLAVFHAIPWDTDGSGKDVFTLAAGPEMLVHFQIDAPNCRLMTDGRLQIGVQGGTPPFQMELQFPDGSSIIYQVNQPQLQQIDRIVSGEYRIRITDALQRSHQENIFVQSVDAPVPVLEDQYELRTGETLLLDATLPETSGPVSYRWRGPAGFQKQDPLVEIRQAGRYELMIEQQGCFSQKAIEILPFQEQNIQDLRLYPNPSVDGWFNLKVSLEKAAGAEMTIYAADGKVLLQRRQQGNRYYHFRENIAVKGAYLIRLRSGPSSKTVPLIIK